MKPQTPYMIAAPILLFGGATLFASGLWILGILSAALGILAYFAARRAMIRGRVDEVLSAGNEEPTDRATPAQAERPQPEEQQSFQ
ncbi:hypothetical protein [Clavibacter sp. MX14-G9D]|uniref:hypothetical protein n=1 Tax=Clavibacter sp. MX14-G9D TaxID=3064656 RepID=UPI00293F65BA|nr:hypothetical protein [Clavibacter sp. MX14-G9D]